jgi:hypothetical protein
MSGAGGAAAMCVGPVTSPQVAGDDHTHVLSLTAAQINTASGDTTHPVTMASGHRHNVVLSAADRAMLRAGMTLRKMSSAAFDHTHRYDILCTGS